MTNIIRTYENIPETLANIFDMMIIRSEIGRAKYGVGLDESMPPENSPEFLGWQNALIEELLDSLVYYSRLSTTLSNDRVKLCTQLGSLQSRFDRNYEALQKAGQELLRLERIAETVDNLEKEIAELKEERDGAWELISVLTKELEGQTSGQS